MLGSMRLVALACGVLCARQFTHGALPTSGAADASDAIRPDTPPLHTAHVRPIQFTSVTGGPHAGFPVLVAISASWLRQVSQGGDVASASGYDIMFSADAPA